jgi:oxygen-dependent protoporphyrinogen oxidase
MDVSCRDHRESLAASAVVVATPTDVATQILQGLSGQFASRLSPIEYAPVAVLSAGYRREDFKRQPDGFGFLAPRSEGLRVLGTVFNSALFPGRAPDGMVSLTSFAGGATAPSFCDLSEEEITETVCAEVARVLGIAGKPVATNLHRYARALPQYNLGHLQIVKSLEALTAATPGLFLAGNYLSGPSIGACVDQSFRTAEAVRVYLASIGVAGVGAVAHA